MEILFLHSFSVWGTSSPKIFDSLSEAVCWILEHNYKLANVLHLLDSRFPEADADRTMVVLTLAFNKLAIPLSPNKTVGPVNELEYQGIILDSTKMRARLPMDKVDRIRSVIISFLNRKSCTKQEAFWDIEKMNKWKEGQCKYRLQGGKVIVNTLLLWHKDKGI